MRNINEQDIRATIDDFNHFCQYVDKNKPVLSKRKAQLGKKDLFDINALLHFRKHVAALHLPLVCNESLCL